MILFPDWEEERFPLYAYYPSRQYLAPKTRAFLSAEMEKYFFGEGSEKPSGYVAPE